MLTVNELFSGIGTQSLALKYLGFPFKVVGISEIDKFAIQAYTALHGETRNYGDISKIDKLDYADLWTYSSPCQDMSSAGKGRGLKVIDENGNEVITRSGLLFEVERLLAKSCGFDILNGELIKNENYEVNPPKYLLLENVSELLKFKKHNVYFYKWLERLEELGYNSYYAILNAKHFGIPQNRERVFTISILGNEYYEFPKGCNCYNKIKVIGNYMPSGHESSRIVDENGLAPTVKENHGTVTAVLQRFEFPPKQELRLKLKDMLEDEVDEKYYLSDKLAREVVYE